MTAVTMTTCDISIVTSLIEIAHDKFDKAYPLIQSKPDKKNRNNIKIVMIFQN